MDPKEQIQQFLQDWKKASVSLADLESIFDHQPCTYEEFARTVRELEEEGFLHCVLSKGSNGKQPSLAYQYKVQRSRLKIELHKDIHQARLRLHPLIQLDGYFAKETGDWQQDLPYIEMIDAYLRSHPLPDTPVPAPERSFELVGDEKWITEKRGEELLTAIGLWHKLRINPVEDPIMMAVNPAGLALTVHRHLIVENKTTYQALLQVLPEVPFTTLIFGGGYRIVKSLEQLPMQLPLASPNHRFYYFGDIDKEGVAIWHLLHERTLLWFDQPVLPALPFYLACLTKPFVFGKKNQRDNERALNSFRSHFPPEQQETMNAIFEAGGYYPQEILHTQELCRLWRNSDWNTQK